MHGKPLHLHAHVALTRASRPHAHLADVAQGRATQTPRPHLHAIAACTRAMTVALTRATSPHAPPSTRMSPSPSTITSRTTTHLVYVVEGRDAAVAAHRGLARYLVDGAAGVRPLRGLHRAGRGEAVPARGVGVYGSCTAGVCMGVMGFTALGVAKP